MSAPAVMLIAEVHGISGGLRELRRLVTELADASRTEAGCEGYRVLGGEQPAELVLLSTWADEAAVRAHYDTTHYRHYRDTVGPLLARPSDVTVHRLDTTVRALDPRPPDPDRFD